MEFSLHAPDHSKEGWSYVEENFTGDATYSITDSGVLVIRDGKGQRRTYAPGAWWMVEATEPGHAHESAFASPVGLNLPSDPRTG